MTSAAIQVDELSKRYRIGREQAAYRTLRDSLASAFAAPWRRIRGRAPNRVYIWALRDVSLEVPQGEVLGLIGSNGSGKTTLLKILSQITPPTAGRAVVRGHVGSLLEVGTGFHPELTGRENIYLNGAILGMRRRETSRKLDEIVEFAEVARFLDTPVKRYSSGMYLRLAFAVAAHLEPEILLVDEVLAVGDARFQQKCLAKMQQVGRSGRTVVFVSHNMAAIRSLCDRAVWIEKGLLTQDGPAGDVVNRYLGSALGDVTGPGRPSLEDFADRSGNGAVRFTSFAVRLADGSGDLPAQTGREVEFVCGYRSATGRPVSDLVVGIDIRSSDGQPIAYLGNQFEGTELRDLPPDGELVCRVPGLPLQAGPYLAVLFCRVSLEVADQLTRPLAFHVLEGDFFGTGRIPPTRFGHVLLPHQWRLTSQESGSVVAPGPGGPALCE